MEPGALSINSIIKCDVYFPMISNADLLLQARGPLLISSIRNYQRSIFYKNVILK